MILKGPQFRNSFRFTGVTEENHEALQPECRVSRPILDLGPSKYGAIMITFLYSRYEDQSALKSDNVRYENDFYCKVEGRIDEIL